MKFILRILTTVAVLIAVKFAAAVEPVDAEHSAKMAAGLVLFKDRVRAVLLESCFKCHGGESVESGFDMTDRDKLLKGGDNGAVVLPHKSAESLLCKLVAHQKKPFMPHEADKLPDSAINDIAAWIDLGAPYDRPLKGGMSTDDWTQKTISPEARKFWSFRPLSLVEPPEVKNADWCRTPIDRFMLAKMETAGVTPNPPASKWQLIRRLYFDLIGLPPKPDEIDAFENNASPDAYEKVVDRLLASPHFGERWARRWLDLARFAESHGFEHDSDRPTAYHYRDFVIRAINVDLSYDTFVKWQLAGDEYEPENPLAMAATGFLAAGVHSTQITKNEAERHRYDEMDDMLATTGTAMLGLTFGCARCHDHKYDPIPQRDYYRMLSAFTTTVRSEPEIDLDHAGNKRLKERFDKEHAPFVAALERFEREQWPIHLAALKALRLASLNLRLLLPAAPSPTDASPKAAATLAWYRKLDSDWQRLNRAAEEHLKKAPKLNTTKMLVATEGLPPIRLYSQGDDFFKECYFLRRGDVNQKAALAKLGVLQVLDTTPDHEKHWQTAPPPGARTSYRRRALAEWITDRHYGAAALLARVEVNRIWQFHFGRGIVATPSDFGARGEPPTHPELLDWLAGELIAGDWRLKPIHKQIVMSAAYMQSAAANDPNAKVDPENRTFWRHPTQRLEAETIRDSLLAVSGLLDPMMFGPGTLDPASRRRSIYFTVKRSKLIPMLTIFDAPDALGGVGQRPTTTVAPQALYLMNNPQVRQYAKAFAARVAPSLETKLDTAVHSAYVTAVGREPTGEESADSLAFIELQTKSYQEAGKAEARQLALADFCQTLICLNEFIYVE
jgi:cytochrome c553